MKRYQSIPIIESNEAMVPLPLDQFAVVNPHPYLKLGASYGARSPFYVRQGVLERLRQAQHYLQRQYPGWRIQIFDAYRPIAVQQFMVDYTLRELATAAGLNPAELTPEQREPLLAQVYEFWAAPSFDPATPPPHSTGGAIDVTLVNEMNQPVDMGSPIDEVSPRSYPQHFAAATTDPERAYHRHRQLLQTVMGKAGFCVHPKEWWHFCYGDQMWAWLMNHERLETALVALYGRVE